MKESPFGVPRPVKSPMAILIRFWLQDAHIALNCRISRTREQSASCIHRMDDIWMASGALHTDYAYSRIS